MQRFNDKIGVMPMVSIPGINVFQKEKEKRNRMR